MRKWKSIDEELPDYSCIYQNLSVDVLIKLRSDKIIQGFYSYFHEKWYSARQGNHIADSQIKGWCYIEE